MKAVLAILAVLALVACVDAPAEEPPQVQAQLYDNPHVSVQLTGPAQDTVDVVVHGLRPGQYLKTVALVDPAGARYPARQFDSATIEDPRVVGSNSNFGFSMGGGSSSGVAGGAGFGYTIWETPVYGDPQTSTRAWIPIPDPARYRATIQGWAVEVIIATTGLPDSKALIPAPPPVN